MRRYKLTQVIADVLRNMTIPNIIGVTVHILLIAAVHLQPGLTIMGSCQQSNASGGPVSNVDCWQAFVLLGGFQVIQTLLTVSLKLYWLA